jgi:thiosulfate/3-mercaptopyruvate sulfurtransferase
MRREDAFISTERLSDLLEKPGVRVVDTRLSLADEDWGRREFEAAHVPGAVYAHWLHDLSDPDDPVQGQLAPPDRFRAAMEERGIGDDTLVVAYDDGVIFGAARLWWCLRAYGHRQAWILEGGWPRWTDEGRPIESGASAPPADGVTFTPRPDPAIRATKEEVLGFLELGEGVLLDCRMNETWESAAAHIPGAERFPAPAVAQMDESEVVAAAAALGADPDTPIVLYCGGGVSASLGFAALERAGYKNLRVYDGSWSEWSADPATAKESH